MVAILLQAIGGFIMAIEEAILHFRKSSVCFFVSRGHFIRQRLLNRMTLRLSTGEPLQMLSRQVVHDAVDDTVDYAN